MWQLVPITVIIQNKNQKEKYKIFLKKILLLNKMKYLKSHEILL